MGIGEYVLFVRLGLDQPRLMAYPVRSLGKGETGIASTQEKKTEDKLSIGQIEGNAVAVLSHIPGRTLISGEYLCLEHCLSS
jgi:hypothetical protein